MHIKGDTVFFEKCDMHFVKKMGLQQAADMALNFKTVSPLPFLYDTYQTAAFFHISRKALFRLVKNAAQEYRLIRIKKKNGGYRTLYAPSPALRACQQRIRQDILDKLPVSKYAAAYIKGRTLIGNASPHVGKRFLLKLDLTDFFGSICFEQVYSAAFHTAYFSKQTGVLLAALCCWEGVLPQGAPTSPALSNLVMRRFDDTIGEWCARRSISYTRYCDDMAFSSDRPLFSAYLKAKSLLNDMGFELNESKTHFVSNAGRQSVTGLTVNQKVSAARGYKHGLRQEVYYALKFGLEESIIRGGKTAFLNGGVPDVNRYYQHLLGRLHFVVQIEPQNVWFQNALKQLKASSGKAAC